MKIPTQPKVIIRHCDDYDPGRIRRIVLEGMDELGVTPFGRTLVKPNCVASKPQFPHAFTRAEFLEGVLLALRDRGHDRMSELAVGERCGITVPTRHAFQGADYYPMFKRTGVKHYHFEEEPQVEIPLSHEGRLRDYLFTPQPIAKADFFVNCPKFKAHPWTTVTFSLKNYIGIQDDRHRLIDHDHRLNEKIADLQYIIQPQLIVIDGIEAGEGRMLTPSPRRLNLILMGNCQVAFDAVCCRILGLDPLDVEHIRLAHQRGFGPVSLDSIQVSGDVTIEQAARRANGFKVGLVRVEKYFEGTKIHAYAGPPPEPERTDYCWGGCPGAIEEAIEILRQFDAQCDEHLKPIHVVFGAYSGPIDAKPGERVVFIGDCATYDGKIGDQLIRIESLYRDRSTKDPHTVTDNDIYAKLVSVTKKLAEANRKQIPLRMAGCPVSVMEQVLMLIGLSDVKNPILDLENALPFNKAYLAWRGKTALARLRGSPYQINGACERGEAAPEVTAE
ncbi:MAG: DUF362 domain-containing protein [Polyangiaceae bacterium]